jgi:hypothetical protein
VLEFHKSKNIVLSEGDEIRKIIKSSGKITNIQYEERLTPVGKWSDQIGEVVI